MLQPAMADGQHAFVLDAKITSRHWFNGHAASRSPLPMLEPAIALWRQRCRFVEAREWPNIGPLPTRFVEKIRQKNPGAMPPDFKIPDPQVREIRSGAIYSYPLPRELGVDGQLAPGAGLGPHVAVLTISPQHTAELLSSTPVRGRRSGRRCQAAAGAAGSSSIRPA